MKRVTFFPIALVAGLIACGCNKTPTAPTTTDIPYSASQVFAGTLTVQGSSSTVFSVQAASTATITLASLTSASTGTILSVPVTVGIAPATATECAPASPVTVAPALTAQITNALSAGSYCVIIRDAGNLSEDTNFAIRVNQDAVVTSGAATSKTDAFSGFATALDSAWQSFTVTQSGQVTVTLSSLSQAGAIGLGLGINGVSSTACTLNTALITAPGSSPQITSTVSPGTYCVKIYNVGQIVGPVSYAVSIVHP